MLKLLPLTFRTSTLIGLKIFKKAGRDNIRLRKEVITNKKQTRKKNRNKPIKKQRKKERKKPKESQAYPLVSLMGTRL